MLFVILVPILLVFSSVTVEASFSWQDVLQNDIFAAMSWALLDIDPKSYVPPQNSSQLLHNQTLGIDGTSELKKGASVKKTSEDATEKKEDGKGRDLEGEKRQFFTFQGKRPKGKVEIRPLVVKLFDIHDGSALKIFYGSGTAAYLDNFFSVKQRSSDDENFLVALEDLVSMMGVDGKACVHRLLCDMGSSPALQNSGLYGEMAEITIRFLLGQQYSSPDNVDFNTIAGSSSRYIDAVSAGRKGADCGAIYDECPVSLIKLIEMIRENNS